MVRTGDVWRVPVDDGGSAEAILSGPFPEYDARISPDGAVAGVRLGGGWPTGSVRSCDVRATKASRGLQQTAAANPSGAATGRSCSTSIVKAIFVADRWDADRAGELTLGPAVPLNVPLIGSGHWGTQYDVSPDGQRVYFIDHTAAAEAERDQRRHRLECAPQVVRNSDRGRLGRSLPIDAAVASDQRRPIAIPFPTSGE